MATAVKLRLTILFLSSLAGLFIYLLLPSNYELVLFNPLVQPVDQINSAVKLLLTFTRSVNETQWVVLVGNGCVYGAKGKKSDFDVEKLVNKIAKKLGGKAGGKGNEFRGGGPNRDGKEIVEALK